MANNLNKRKLNKHCQMFICLENSVKNKNRQLLKHICLREMNSTFILSVNLLSNKF
jgi:hypothetical protein